jgi:hypothetical protein
MVFLGFVLHAGTVQTTGRNYFFLSCSRHDLGWETQSLSQGTVMHIQCVPSEKSGSGKGMILFLT